MRHFPVLVLSWLLAGPLVATPPADPSLGNNPEAVTSAKACQTFLARYAQGADLKLYLKLVAPEKAELALEEGGDKREYRKNVEIAYLLVWVPSTEWIHASESRRRQLATVHLNLLRSLYPKASLFITVLDGPDAVAHANWKRGEGEPKSELL